MKLFTFPALEFWFRVHRKSLTRACHVENEGKGLTASAAFWGSLQHNAGANAKVIIDGDRNPLRLPEKPDLQRNQHVRDNLPLNKARSNTSWPNGSETPKRLHRVAQSVFETPIGQQNEWMMHLCGFSNAKVLKEI